MKKIFLGGFGIILTGVLIITPIALINETNPPVVQEPAWDSPQTRVLAERACFDCHSNETHWPWWTRMPFGSWLVALDVNRGRETLNFSEWGVSVRRAGAHLGEHGEDPVHEIGEVIQEGHMPPGQYLLMHPEARLTSAEKQQLINGFQLSLK